MVLPFYNEKGILQLLLERMSAIINEIPIVVATSDAANDDRIAAVAAAQHKLVYRGSEDNVLERFIGAAKQYGFEKIIRVCADNPFLDMAALQWQIERFKEADSDYFCYCLSDYTPTIKTHYGFWTEAVKLTALEKVVKETDEQFFQEHVTNYIYSFPDKFRIHYIPVDSEIEKTDSLRLTVDSPQDFELAREVYLFLETNCIPFTALEITRSIKDNGEWMKQMTSQIKKNSK
jgi:spore coat polysaccharide biosynthesis protein SpsF